jgi:LytS/YehU family sensor histidine kinase
VLWVAHRFRLGREHLRERLLIHVGAAVALAAIHVALSGLIETRSVMPFFAQNPNQLTGNLFIYCALVAWVHTRQFYQWYQERGSATSRIEAAIARSRYQALCVQLRPQLLLGTLERLEGLVHEDVPRAERLIARLGDVLRLTLDGASDEVTTLRKELDLLRAYADVYQLGTREGVDLSIDAPPELLSLTLPNRLLRTIADDMLAPVQPGAEARLIVVVSRDRGETQVKLRLESPAPRSSVRGGEPWSASVEAAALAEADQRVSLFFPDSRSALVVLADEPPVASLGHVGRESSPVSAA